MMKVNFRLHIYALTISLSLIGTASADDTHHLEPVRLMGVMISIPFAEPVHRIDGEGRVTFVMYPHTRTPDYFSVEPFTRRKLDVLVNHVSNTAGLRLSYNLETANGGSGGPLYILNGRLDGLQKPLRITCQTQSELAHDPRGALTWCLHKVLRITPVSD